MQLSIGICILVAVYYWLCNLDLGNLGRALMNPTFIGVLFGLIYGDVVTGTILGASINIMYISVAAVGANMPADDSLAACVAIPIALSSGLDPETAALLAVPFGILGTFMDNLRRMVNGVWNRKALVYAEKLNFKGITFCNTLGPWAVQFIIRVPIVTAIMIGVSTGTAAIMDVIPAWIMNALSVVGGVLPGFGLVLCATFIGRKHLFPFFIAGFFVMKLSGMPMLVATMFGLILGIIYVQLAFPKAEGEESFNFSELFGKGQGYDGTVTKSDCHRTAWRVILFHRFGNSLEAMYGTGVGHAMTPVLRKLYKNNDEELSAALQRHLLPYISEMSLGNCIMGAALAMEEQIALGEEDITGEDVITLKSSLMGPFAGFGDSILWTTLAPVIRTVFLPFALGGSVVAGLLMEPLIRLGSCIASVFSFDLGYKMGRRSIMALLKGGWMKKLMTGGGVLGMFMLGCMGSSYCKLNVVLEIATDAIDKTYVIQSMLDGIMPGLIPFLLLLGTYRYFSKGGKYLKLIIITLVAALALSFFGIV